MRLLLGVREEYDIVSPSHCAVETVAGHVAFFHSHTFTETLRNTHVHNTRPHTQAHIDSQSHKYTDTQKHALHAHIHTTQAYTSNTHRHTQTHRHRKHTDRHKHSHAFTETLRNTIHMHNMHTTQAHKEPFSSLLGSSENQFRGSPKQSTFLNPQSTPQPLSCPKGLHYPWPCAP